MSRRRTRAQIMAELDAMRDLFAESEDGTPLLDPRDAFELAAEALHAILADEPLPKPVAPSPEVERVRAWLDAIDAYDLPPGRPLYAEQVMPVVQRDDLPSVGDRVVALSRADLRVLVGRS